MASVIGQKTGAIYEYVMEMQTEFPEEAQQLFLKNEALRIPSDAGKYVKKADYFQLKDVFLDEIKSQRPNALYLDIPFEGNTLKAQLYKKEITAYNYKVKTASGTPTYMTNSIFYRGVLKGKPKSIVSLSVTGSGLRMTISNGKDNFEINQIENDLYAAYRISDSKHKQETGCSTDKSFGSKKKGLHINKDSGTRAGDCIEVYIECDFDSYLTNGASIQNTEDWALAIMNEVAILYDNAGIPMVVSDILVYDQGDPYLAGSDAGEMLGLMGSVIGNNYNGRLAHVFSTRSVGGGVAYVNVLCQTNNGGSYGPFAVSGSMNGSTIPFPIFSWNVMVVAHELGHNVGSLHTHDCEWNGNDTQIDDCGNEATDQGAGNPCYDENNPILPTAGSIMSYCHLIGSIGIDFNIGFHPQVADLLFSRYTSAPCVTGENCSGGGSPPIADFTFTQLNLCNPAEVQFTDLSQNNPSTYEWSFPGGEPSFSNEQNPFVIYSEPGFYDVTLMVSNFAGEDVLTLNQVIAVVETPVPDFDYEVDGYEMKFTNQTTGSVNSYFWDFSDGGSSTEENPCYAWEEDGSYLVNLTIESVCGTFEIEKYVDFFTPPIADFTADTMQGCTPLAVNFTNHSSSNSEDYLWIFEGGNPEASTQENPVVMYDSAGVFGVMLIVTNDLGMDTLDMPNYISVEPNPIIGFDFEVDSLEVLFTNNSENYDTLTWEFGDGNTSTVTNPTYTYEEEGVYEVTLMVSNLCDTLSMTQTIELISAPVADYSVNVTEGCLPLSVTFTNNSSTNVDSWHWSFPGGAPSMSMEEHPIVVYEQAGTFDVLLVVSNESGTDTMEEMNLIVVDNIPSASFEYAVEDLEVTFVETSVGYESISWDFGDGNTSSEANPVHSYESDGIYEVVLTATNSCGDHTAVQTIGVSTLPTAGFLGNTAEGCIPFVVEFTNTSSSNATAFEWSFPGGVPAMSTNEHPVISYESAGVYDVTLIATSFAGKDTMEMESYISSYTTPIADFEYDALSEFEYSFENLSVDGDAYFWDFGDGATTSEANPVHVYNEPGTYKIVLTVTNQCGEVTHEDEILIVETSIVNELEIIEEIIVFPNPNSGVFTISLKSLASEKLDVKIVNMLGQVVLKDSFQVNSGANIKSIRLEETISGIYMLLIQNEDQWFVTKMYVD